MNEREIYETALKQVCNEIKQVIEENQKSGMTDQRLDRLDKLYHTKKDILATWGMEHPEEYYEENMSGMRGRSPSTGRYVSRESYDKGYNSGYEQGYSNAMSGHWPTQNPYYPEQRRW